MEKWKVLVIVLLIGMLGGYGAYQSVQSQAPTQPDPAAAKPEPPQLNFVGKKLPGWNIAPGYWMNTKAPVSLADLAGHVSIVEIFRISCPHCQEAAPMMDVLYQTYAPKGLKMVSIQSPGTAPEENDWKQVQATVVQWKFKQPVAFDHKSSYFKKSLSGSSYPSIYVLDKKGVVQYQQTGMTEERAMALKAKLKEMMGH